MELKNNQSTKWFKTNNNSKNEDQINKKNKEKIKLSRMK